MLPSFTYVRPTTLADATEQAREPGARLHGGGTDLLGCLRDGVFGADRLVSLSGVKELRGVSELRGGALRIGARTTLTELSEHRVVRERFAVLAQAAAAAASPQLRNQGTLGGNLCQKPRCWYYRGEFDCLRKGGDLCYAVGGENRYHCIFGGEGCYVVHPSDPAPALVALNARVEVAGPKGKREVPVEGFHVPPADDPQRETVLEPGEIVTAVLVPTPAKGLRSRYRKVRTRRAWDFALVGVALALDMKGDRVRDGRVVFSGVAPVPWRSTAVEKVVRGSRLDDATVARALDAAVAGAQPMEQNGYKVALLRGALEEELRAMARG